MLMKEFNRKEERLGMAKGMCDSIRFPIRRGGWDAGIGVGISHQKEKGHFLRVLHSNAYLSGHSGL